MRALRVIAGVLIKDIGFSSRARRSLHRLCTGVATHAVFHWRTFRTRGTLGHFDLARVVI